jgi:hypothetical protein
VRLTNRKELAQYLLWAIQEERTDGVYALAGHNYTLQRSTSGDGTVSLFREGVFLGAFIPKKVSHYAILERINSIERI